MYKVYKINTDRYLSLRLLAVDYYVKKTGTNVAVINGYTFYYNYNNRNKNTQRWPCSRRDARSCKAAFTTTKNGEIIRANLDHNHPPTKFVIHNGVYMRI